ncbi:MAG: hypothetical protein Q9194_006579 [Teloschistes cf. exilis]
MIIQSINYGGCTDLWNVSKANYKKFTKLFHKLEIIARIGMFFTKTAILLLFHRIFVPAGSPRTRVWWAIWVVFWWNLLYAVALILSVALQCVGKDALVAAGKECVDDGVLASVARLGYQIAYASRPNKTIIFVTLLLINAAEQFIGICVSCMPILPAFYRHLFSKPTQTTAPYKTSSDKSHSRTRGLSASIYDHRRMVHAQGEGGKAYQMYKTKGYEEIEAAELGRVRSSSAGIVKRTDLTVVSEGRSRESSSPVLLGV